jgi:hypothetical protein
MINLAVIDNLARRFNTKTPNLAKPPKATERHNFD